MSDSPRATSGIPRVKIRPSPSISATAHAQLAEGLHFSYSDVHGYVEVDKLKLLKVVVGLPEAGARYRSCFVFNNDVLHMVVVSRAGFGNQATTWGDKQGPCDRAPRKARGTPRRLWQVALRANQRQASQLEMCTLTYRRYWRLRVTLQVCQLAW